MFKTIPELGSFHEHDDDKGAFDQLRTAVEAASQLLEPIRVKQPVSEH